MPEMAARDCDPVRPGLRQAEEIQQRGSGIAFVRNAPIPDRRGRATAGVNQHRLHGRGAEADAKAE